MVPLVIVLNVLRHAMLTVLQTLTVLHTAGIGRKTARRMQRVAADRDLDDLNPDHLDSDHLDASDLGSDDGSRSGDDPRDVDIAELQAVLGRVRDDHPRMPRPGRDAFAEGIEAARAVLSACRGEDISVDVPGESGSGYPARLTDVENRPPVLYRRGTLSSAPPGATGGRGQARGIEAV